MGTDLHMRWRPLLTRICVYELIALAVCALFYVLVGVDTPIRALITTAGGLGAVLVSSWQLAKSISTPLQQIRASAEDMAQGGEIRRVDIGDDEACLPLAQAVDAMARRLGNRIEVVDSERLRLGSILSSMVEGVVACDRELRVVHINAVAAGILGTNAQDAISRPLWEVTRFPRISDTLSETIREGNERVHEVEIPGEGHDRIIEVKTSALRNAEGDVIGAVLMLHDVSRMRRLEVMRRDFVANVSHELKTPLTAIEGITETLLGDADMDLETRTRFVARLRKQNDRLSALVADLLHLGRVEDESRSERRRKIDLVAVLEESIAGLSPEAEEKGLAFETELLPAPQSVFGNAENLRQVSDNLLKNAIRYTPSEGSISIRMFEDAATLGFSVQDSGVGIEPTKLARIFERFFRVDEARSRELGGTGLGLAIVKNVVQSHGGEVEVESTPGQGSTFRVTLPRADAGVASD